jgi:GNAT superfamily N-acetyltransferase
MPIGSLHGNRPVACRVSGIDPHMSNMAHCLPAARIGADGMERRMLRHDSDALRIVDGLSALYARVFSAPPWNKAHPEGVTGLAAGFARRMRHDVNRPGFRLLVTGTAPDLTGFASGWITQAPFRTDRAYPKAAANLGAQRVEELLVGAFEVDELAVRAGMRGTGLGRRLLGELIADAPDGRAWLLTWRGAPDTVAFYRRIGWHEVEPLPGMDNDIVVFLSPAHPAA